MEVLKYLKTNPVDDLKEEFGIKYKLYDNGLCVLNYDQINSPKFNPIVRECRGLIIDIFSLRPVSRTFNRFFNLNEDPNDLFNPKLIKRAEEKADGSLISVYWYGDRWNVASRGNAYAEGSTPFGKTFCDIFMEIIDMPLERFMTNMFRDHSFTFELCSMYNKVIKMYETPVLYLLNAVELKSGKEMDSYSLDHCAVTLGVNRPKLYDIDIDTVFESFKDFPATEEGYVLIDVHGNRVKVKNPSYVELHHIKGNGEITPKRICNVVFRGELDEVLSYFPEYREFFDPYQAAYDFMVDEINQIWNNINKIDDQKEFALTIKDLPYKTILFSMRKGLTFEEAIGKLSSSGKVDLLEKLL
jgi:hypothetical protein